MDENTSSTFDGAAAGAGGGTAGGGESSGGRFGRAREYVGSKYEAASDAMRDGYKNVRERVDSTDFNAIGDQVRTYVRSNPGKALLISVGVGFIVGMLLRRNEDED